MRQIRVGLAGRLAHVLDLRSCLRLVLSGLFIFAFTFLPSSFAEAQAHPRSDSLFSLGWDEPTLQEILDGLGYGITVATDETGIELWPVMDELYCEIMYAEVAYYAPHTASGWYEKHSPNDTTVIFVGDDEPVDTVCFYITGTDSIGLFIDPVVEDVWFSEMSLCSDNADHAWVFLTGNPHEFIIAWEDLPGDDWDADFQDLVILFRPPDQPPVLTVPDDFGVSLCEPETLCINPILAFDVDYNDSAVISKIEGPGCFDPAADEACFLPEAEDSVYRFVFRAADIEGAVDEETVYVTVDVNEPPVVTLPEDFDLFSCDTTTFCFGVGVSDPDGEAVVTVHSAGYYDPLKGSICFPAYQETSYCFKIIATDICGACDSEEVCINVDLSDPPVVSAPDTIVLYPEQSVQCTVTAYDPEGETLERYLNVPTSPDCGEYFVERLSGAGTSSGEWKITFEARECTVGYYVMAFEIGDSCGNTGSDTTFVELKQPSGVDEEKVEKIAGFFLKQNFPNPFNLNTGISFELPRQCNVKLKIYNVKGQLVKSVVEKRMETGAHTVFWDGTDYKGNPVASGIYFYKLTAPDFVSVRKMILLK